MNDIYVTAKYPNPPKEMTVDEIKKALGHPVKIVGEDLYENT